MIQHGQRFLISAMAIFTLVVAVSMPALAAKGLVLKLPPGSQDASVGEHLRLYGMPVTMRVFDVPLGLSALAKWFSDQQTGLTELSVMPGKIVLSGVVDEELWTVLMEPQGARRTAGSISILSAPLKRSMPSPSFAGMPNDARLRFDFSSVESGERVTQQVWSSSWSPERLRSALHSGLRNTGWQTSQRTSHSELWTRGASRLQLTMVHTKEGTGIWLLQQDEL